MFKKHNLIWLVLLLALGVRLYAWKEYGLSLTLNSDDVGYTRSAQWLLQTGILAYHDPQEPTVHIMPGQSFLLATVFWVFGVGAKGIYAAKLMMIAFGTASVYGLYRIGAYLQNVWAGLIAALLMALYPPLILTDNLLLTEAPFIFSFIYLLYFSIKLGNERKMRDFYLLMFFYIVGIMIRPTIGLFPLVLLVYLLLKKYPVKLMMKQAGIAALILLLVLAPWWIRNYSHYHEFIPLSGGEGNPLLLGAYQGERLPNAETVEQGLNNVAKQYTSPNAFYALKLQEKYAKKRMKMWFAQDPSGFLYNYLWVKPGLLWEKPFYWIELFGIKKAQVESLHSFFLQAGLWLGVVSLLLAAKRREVLLIALTLAYLTYLYSFYFVMDRYNLPLMPFVFLAIGVGLTAIFTRMQKKGTRA